MRKVNDAQFGDRLHEPGFQDQFLVAAGSAVIELTGERCKKLHGLKTP
jgi:hypothetical protein